MRLQDMAQNSFFSDVIDSEASWLHFLDSALDHYLSFQHVPILFNTTGIYTTNINNTSYNTGYQAISNHALNNWQNV